MKTIAVLMHSLTVEYELNVLQGITDFFKDKDVKLIISQVKFPHSKVANYEYHYWTGVEYLFSNQIDGVIVLSGSFIISITEATLTQEFRNFQKHPIISVPLDLQLPNASYFKINNQSAYDKIITHLKKDHNCKKIAFLSGENIKSSESRNRFQCFLSAMKKNGLEFDENLFFSSGFTAATTFETLQKRYSKKKDIDFDAVIAANDIMANACSHFLQSLGVKVPEDVKVVGYDNTSHSILANPPITTIDQKIYEQGEKAAALIYKKIQGKKIPKVTTLNTTPILRESSGHQTKKEKNLMYEQYDKTANGKLHNFIGKIDGVYSLVDITNSSHTLKQLFYSLPYMISSLNCRYMIVCLFDQPEYLHAEQDFKLPSSINLSMVIDNAEGKSQFEPGISFNPKETIIPDCILSDHKGNFILMPIFSANKNYGYLVCQLDTLDFATITLALRIITNSISQAFEYTERISENQKLSEENLQLHQDNSNLDRRAKTDELTRALNRRGFMEQGQQSIDMAIERNLTGLVFFADLDNLKKINDTYGHETGDLAIKSMTSILEKTLRANDIVARLGGDEFACIAVGMGYDHIDVIRNKINNYCKETMEKHHYAFTLSCSIGIVEFNQDHSNLKELLQIADERLYTEKRQKHSR